MVRDNAGGVTYGGVTVTIDGNSGPFRTEQTITRSVNGTDGGAVNCASINILLSTDGGQTFPITLVADTPNDGSESVTLPNNPTAMARIKVEAVGNIFFDISNSDFSITDGAGVPIVSLSAPDSIAVEGATGPGSPGGGRMSADDEDLTGYAFFCFERTNADEKLTVRFEITGTAAGDPRFTIADTVSFEVGELSFDLYVIPGEDDIDDEDEILTLTLIDEEEYDVLESENNASILIKDNDSTPDPLTVNTPTAQTATTKQNKSGNAATELSPTGGIAPYAYSVGTCMGSNGAAALPGNSLTVNASTGAYTYTAPATAGTYYFCIKVCDAATTANCQTATYTVTVTAPVDNSCGFGGVKMCFYGREICIAPYLVPTYKRFGATLGGCSNPAARISAEEFNKSSGVPLALSVEAYPNPTTDVVAVQVLSLAAGTAHFEVLDLIGRPMQLRTENLKEGVNDLEFRLGTFPSGLYLIRATTALNHQAVVRVSKQ